MRTVKSLAFGLVHSSQNPLKRLHGERPFHNIFASLKHLARPWAALGLVYRGLKPLLRLLSLVTQLLEFVDEVHGDVGVVGKLEGGLGLLPLVDDKALLLLLHVVPGSGPADNQGGVLQGGALQGGGAQVGLLLLPLAADVLLPHPLHDGLHDAEVGRVDRVELAGGEEEVCVEEGVVLVVHVGPEPLLGGGGDKSLAETAADSSVWDEHLGATGGGEGSR